MTPVLTLCPSGDMCLTHADARGDNLARALKARHAPAVASWYLTPARAFYWETLHAAGWDARQTNVGRLASSAWVFFRTTDRARIYALKEALRLAQAPEAVEV